MLIYAKTGVRIGSDASPVPIPPESSHETLLNIQILQPPYCISKKPGMAAEFSRRDFGEISLFY